MNHETLENFQRQAAERERQREERLQYLLSKAQRCQDEISWKIYPSGGPVAINLDHIRQAVEELCIAVEELRTLEQRHPEWEGSHV